MELSKHITRLTALQELNLSAWSIPPFESTIFPSIHSLEILDISENDWLWCRSLPSLPCLKVLRCNQCKLSELQNISHYSGLVELSICKNELQSLPTWFESFTRLRVLRCSNNKLQELPAFFSKLANLETLECSDNKLTSIQHLSCGNLTQLDLSRNVLMQFSDTCSRLTALEILHCTKVGLRSFPAALTNLTKTFSLTFGLKFESARSTARLHFSSDRPGDTPL